MAQPPRQAYGDATILTAVDFLAPFDLMKFTLTYMGELRAAGNNSTRAAEKWEIRKALRPQLAELWATHPVLQGLGLSAEAQIRASFWGAVWTTGLPDIGYDHNKYRDAEIDVQLKLDQNRRTTLKLLEPIRVDDSTFLPLVRQSLALSCDLDIMFIDRKSVV